MNALPKLSSCVMVADLAIRVLPLRMRKRSNESKATKNSLETKTFRVYRGWFELTQQYGAEVQTLRLCSTITALIPVKIILTLIYRTTPSL